MEPSRCKRCEVWVYDGSPMCPNCTKRHNEVYNHAKYNHNENIGFIEKNKMIWPRLSLFLFCVIILFIVYLFTNHYFTTKIDLDSFPPNAHVFEFDEHLFQTRTNSPLSIVTDENFGYFIKLVEYETSNTVISFFLHPNKTFDLTIPEGNYYILYGLGKKWENIQTYFGSEGNYFKSSRVLTFTESLGYTVHIKNDGGLNSNLLELELSDFE